jgi:tetratricopeptide (TPR) repeat protein
MASNPKSNEVFVGREAEQNAFAATLNELTARPGRWPFKKESREKSQPRVFLISGSGGMGKTSLLRQLGKQCQEHEVRWVLLNWDDVHDAGSLPRDFSSLTVKLFNAMADQLGGDVSRRFDAFVSTHANHGQIEERVKRYRPEARQEYAQLVSVAAATAGAVAGKQLAEVPGVEQLAAAGFEHAVHAGAAGLARFEDFLDQKLRQLLSADEYRLYTNPDEQYANAFVQGLLALAQAEPVVITQDTYEWISGGGELDAQLRALIIKTAVQKTDAMAFVVSGREDLHDAYQRSFDSHPELLYRTVLQPFTLEETQALLKAYELEPDLGDKVQLKTMGVPLSLTTLTSLIHERGEERITSHFPDLDVLINEGEVIQQTVRRFLRYILETAHDSPEVARQKRTERQQIYALALLRRYDAGALGACWGTLDGAEAFATDRVLEQLRLLRQRNEFLFERGEHRMQSLVRQYIREYLRQQLEPDAGFLETDLVRGLNRAALDYYDSRIEERALGLRTIPERLGDDQWRGLVLDRLDQLFWSKGRDGLQELCCRVLEAATFERDWLPDLLLIAKEAQPVDPALISALAAGIGSWRSQQPDVATLQTMWDVVGDRLEKWPLPPVYRALLALLRGQLLAAQSRPDKASREMEIGLEVLPADVAPALQQRLLDGLAAIAAMFVIEERTYPEAIATAEKVLAYDPDHVRAHQFRLMGMLGQQDYERVDATLDDLIDRYPDTLDFRWLRQSLYWIQDRKAEAIADLREMARLQPDAIRDWMHGFVELSKDPQVWEAVKDWGVDSGWSQKSYATFTRLQQSLPPEVLADLIVAQLELLSIEQPTAAQIIRTRELYAQHLSDWPDVQLQLGIAYLAAGRLDEAIAAFERARALASDNPEMAVVPAQILHLRGHYAEALPFLEAAIELVPDNPGPDLLMITALQNLGRTDEAKAHAEATVTAYPDNALVRASHGYILSAAGEEERGWRQMHEAYIADPTSLDVIRSGLAIQAIWNPDTLKQLIRDELSGEAGEILAGLPASDMIRLYSELYRAYVAGEAFDKPDLSGIISVLEELLTFKADAIGLRVELARLYDQMGEAHRAIALLEGVLDQLPQVEQVALRNSLVKLYYNEGQIGPAIRHLEHSIEASPTAEAYDLLADLYENQGEITKAMEAFDAALALAEETDADRLRKYGLYNLTNDRADRAEALLRLALEQRPDDAFTHAYLAEALYRQKRFDDARASAEQALKLAPGAPDPLARLYRISRALEAAQEADRYHQQALEGLPSLTAYEQACVLALLEEPDQAMAHLEKALARAPDQRSWAAHDPDLRSLHEHPDFQRVVMSEPDE